MFSSNFVFFNECQRFEYGAFGIFKHLLFGFALCLLIDIILVLSTICQMHYIFCCVPYFYVFHLSISDINEFNFSPKSSIFNELLSIYSIISFENNVLLRLYFSFIFEFVIFSSNFMSLSFLNTTLYLCRSRSHFVIV